MISGLVVIVIAPRSINFPISRGIVFVCVCVCRGKGELIKGICPRKMLKTIGHIEIINILNVVEIVGG